jgi:hypothetical protein
MTADVALPPSPARSARDLSHRGRGNVRAAAASPLPWWERSAAQQPSEGGNATSAGVSAPP